MLHLKTHSADLRIERGDNDWSRVHLLSTNGLDIELGAGTFSYIQKRLLKMLQDQDLKRSNRIIDGAEIHHALMLSEKHYSIFFSRQGPALTLYFQDADGHIDAIIKLDESDCRAWADILTAEM